VSLESGRSWMVPLASREGVLGERHPRMFKWRADVEVAVGAKLLRHLVKTWSRLKRIQNEDLERELDD
jgi:hypothetical protein